MVDRAYIGDCRLKAERRTCLAPAWGFVALRVSDFGRRQENGVSVNHVSEKREQEEIRKRVTGGLVLTINNWGSVFSGPLRATKLLPWNCHLR